LPHDKILSIECKFVKFVNETNKGIERPNILLKKKNQEKIKQVRSLTKATGIADIGIHRDDLL